MVELTEQQRQAVKNGEAVRVASSEGEDLVLLRATEYENMRAERNLYLEAVYAAKQAPAPAEALPSYDDLVRTSTKPIPFDL
jgi:PHD/YefM family antitoxin component YafN of YafNO toxin-antitoxin module